MMHATAISGYATTQNWKLLMSVAFTVRTLQMFQTSRNRCPQTSIHSFVKTLCDLYQRPFKRSISRQFSICLDLYLELRRQVEHRVMATLQRNSPDWRLRHACVACTYTLKDENPLKFKMLYTVDGNDSLKRIARREAGLQYDDEDATTHPVLGASSESTDSRRVGQGLHLTKEEVDTLSSQQSVEEDITDEDDGNPCAERWRNMKTTLTARMWGIFEETGIFMALCRHGFSLLMTDMVRSGELSKYPIAIVSKMLDVFGKDLALGYDIGCRFSTTLLNSPIAAKVKKNNHRSLVGTFHGHAHNRLCQSKNLATYVEGVGLDAFEGCEPHFSESNKMAGSTRYASPFHRLQTIVEFTHHRDRFEKYQNLSTFLLNNYKQALDILSTKDEVMNTLKKLGAESGKVVEGWLKEEEEYLSNLKREPAEETMEMEYFVLLGNLMLAEDALQRANSVFGLNITPDTIHLPDKTLATETSRRHLRETHAARLSAVQAMEKCLGIQQRWTRDSDKWKETAERVALRQYQRSLDTLEGLVVSRMFELAKMNMSQTGYSLRKHIAAALKSRSNAIRTALAKYNAAAAALDPPRQELSWEEVVDYAFLADFDLLRDCRQDIRLRPWATSAARHTMDRYFKLLRAAEEIDRLNIEIHRLWTFMRDEDEFLLAKEKEIAASNPSLASAISAYRSETSRFREHHTTIINQIRQLKGYTGKPATCFGVVVSERKTQKRPSASSQPQPPNPHAPLPMNSPSPIPSSSIQAFSTTSTESNPHCTPMEVDYQEDKDDDFEQEQAGEDEDDAVLVALTGLLHVCDDK
ncbi:hypothetical protein BJ165DRAFT_1509152 [Panaeolus papilionaceus]|nr:hypothetical protein BJ165DRAFT_1509152 [Panaeolus papilionaceus]